MRLAGGRTPRSFVLGRRSRDMPNLLQNRPRACAPNRVSSAGVSEKSEALQTGVLIVNADDWGRDCRTTGRILDCALRGAVSSVSAMVFMEDSERAATLARERGIDVGLHLNFTTSFSASGCPAGLVDRQQELRRYLRCHRLAQ